jgi:NAD(P)-dependent dehydrogenase (short-subunit alcohol dehydrogenase family)
MSIRQLLDLSGRVALVTGGSRGIGLQMATALGEMGARVALTARKQGELDAARAQLEADGVECMTVAGDLSAPASIVTAVDAVLSRWQAIDIVVNNAGTNWAAPAEDYPTEAWRKVLDLNLDAAFFLLREVAKRSMIPRQSGKIVNIASVAGFLGAPPAWEMQTAAYNTSKGALIALTRALAAEWGRYNINVNAICPGFFPSKMTSVTLDRIGREVVAMTPLARLGGDEDLKGSVVFLASDAARHVTGHTLVVDGGCSIV